MYTKLGLGLLAAAGLTFGVVGMQTGGASPTSTACTDSDAGVSASPSGSGSAGAADHNGSNPSGTGNGAGAEGNGNGLGEGSGSGNDSGGGDNGPSTTTPPTSGDNGNPSTGATVDDRFLVLRGHTDETDIGDGTATVPPTNSGATGRSRTVSRLLRIDVHVDARR